MDERNTIGINFIERLSGGNHELFHSNLLAFLAEHEPKYFRTLFKGLGNIPDDATNYVRREKLNMDLTLWDKDQKHIVFALENKVKSFPDIKQLEEYDEKIRKINKGEVDCLKVLLALMITDKDKGEIEKRGWRVITYDNLLKQMDNAKLRDKETYLGQFLEDYKQYLKELVKTAKEAEKFVSEDSSTLSYLFELVKDAKEENKEKKWRAALKSRAIYHHIKKRIEDELNNDRIKFLVTVSHGSPLIELRVYLTPESYSILENKGKEEINKLEFYFIIFQDQKLLHGFRIYDEKAKPYKGKHKANNPDRKKWLRKKWKEQITSDSGKKIIAEFIKNGINVNLNDYPHTKEKEEEEKHPAFVFDDAAMPHIVKEFPSNSSMTLKKIIDKIKKEITAADNAVYGMINNKQ